jgi:hypothetical protein
MLTVKLSDVLNAKNPLEALIQVKLPIKLAYSASKLLRLLTPELDNLDKIRLETAEKYGTKTDTGYDIPESNRDEFLREMTELLATDVTILYDKIDMSPVIDKIELTTLDVMQLEPFFKFD